MSSGRGQRLLHTHANIPLLIFGGNYLSTHHKLDDEQLSDVNPFSTFQIDDNKFLTSPNLFLPGRGCCNPSWGYGGYGMLSEAWGGASIT